METAGKRGRIRLGRWILIFLGGVVGVGSLAAPAGASVGPHPAAGTLANVISVASSGLVNSLGSDCAVLSTGNVDCWGYNGSGQLGNGSTAGQSDVPVAVLGISDAKAVASDTYSNSFCAVLTTGHVKCWGDNSDGELGNGTTTTSDVPVLVKNITTAAAVIGGDSGGADGFCALLSTSHVDCWGEGFSGELGNGATANSDVPVAVHNVTDAATLISGFEGFCALLSTSHIDCWGDNTFGELGRATPDGNYSDVPVAVTGITDAKAVASDSADASECAVLSTGRVKCWGEGGSGQLGNGTTANSDVPVTATGITDAKAVASDGDGESFCAVLSTGHMKCWGFNNYGQLGNGTATGSSVPVSVKNITTATAVTGTIDDFCALLSTGHVDCWGYGFYGQLGNGNTASSEVPVAVHNITNAATLISGLYGFCSLLVTGNVDCWGYGYFGQLGNGNTASSDVPVAVVAAS